MLRILFALLCIVSTAHAERIVITSASVTYFTATDRLEIVVQLSEPLNFAGGDYFSFGGAANSTPPWGEMFAMNSEGRAANEIREPFYVGYVSYSSRGDITQRMAMGMPEVDTEGSHFLATLPFSMAGLDDPEFTFWVTWTRPLSIFHDSREYASLEGLSSVNQRVVYTTEPSAVSLCLIGVVGLVVHRLVRCPGKGL